MKRIGTSIAAALVAIGILQPLAPEAQAAAQVVTATMRGSVVTVTGTSGPDVLRVMNFCDSEVECSASVVGRGVTFKPGPGCKRRTRGLYCESPTPLTLVVRLGAGDDRLTTDDYYDTHQFAKLVVYGGPGDDTFLPGNAMDETWFGGPGDDYLRVDTKAEGPEQVGPDLFRGGAGEDTADYSYTSNAAFVGVNVSLDNKRNDGVGSAADADDIGRDVEVVIGTDGPDELIGNKGRQRFEGRAGNDEIRPMGGADVVFGGRGDDSLLTVDGKSDQVDCGLGQDSLLSDKEEANDRANNCEYRTYRVGANRAAGHARASTRTQAAPAEGTPSKATFSATADAVTVVGNNGAQLLFVDVNCLTVGCELEFYFEDDSLRPQLTPKVGEGCVIGEDKLDVVCKTTTTTPTATIDLGGGDDILHLDYEEMVDGSEVTFVVRGGEGNDFMLGGHGHETWDGGPGDDTFVLDYNPDVSSSTDNPVVAAGFDEVRGGPGVDTVDYDHGVYRKGVEPGVSVTLDDLANDGSGIGTDIDNVHSDVENILGGGGPDTLSLAGWEPSTGKNAEWVFPTIDGAGGDDVILGSALDERLLGSKGNDTITGGAGDDWIFGGGDDDTLDGGPGRDLIAGGRPSKDEGSGNDRIVSRDDFSDRVLCADGRDEVDADPSDTYLDRDNCEAISVKPHPGTSPQALPRVSTRIRVDDTRSSAQARVSSGNAKVRRMAPVRLTIVSATGRGQVLARGRMTLPRGFVGITTLQLTARARTLLASTRNVEAQLILNNGWEKITKPVRLTR